MELLGIVVVLILFAIQVAYTIYKARDCLADDKSLNSKVCTAVAFAVCMCFVIFNSSCIASPDTWQLRSLSEEPFTLVSIVGIVFAWWVFTVFFGSALAALQFSALMIWLYRKVGRFRRWSVPPGGDAAVFTSINAAGIAVAYNLMLYTFGMSDWLIIEILT